MANFHIHTADLNYLKLYGGWIYIWAEKDLKFVMVTVHYSTIYSESLVEQVYKTEFNGYLLHPLNLESFIHY